MRAEVLNVLCGLVGYAYGFHVPTEDRKGIRGAPATAGGKSSPSSSMRKKCTGRSFLISVLDGLPN